MTEILVTIGITILFVGAAAVGFAAGFLYATFMVGKALREGRLVNVQERKGA